VLDEPFSGLDPVGTDVLVEMLDRERRERGVPIVFSSHQLELVERVCDRVAMILDGRIVADGTIEELRASRERRLLRVEVSGGDGWFESIPGVRLAERLAGGVVLELEDGTDHQRVLDLARSVGEVRHFSMVRPTLSQLFREVVSS
jgi:ABC-2 type transport system ATP-binding protein